MENLFFVFLIYLLIINFLTFLLFLIDKIKAKIDAFRISEKTLLVLCLIGGALGGLFSMLFFNHKTRKPKFIITVPILTIIYTILTIFMLLF